MTRWVTSDERGVGEAIDAEEPEEAVEDEVQDYAQMAAVGSHQGIFQRQIGHLVQVEEIISHEVVGDHNGLDDRGGEQGNQERCVMGRDAHWASRAP